MERIPEGDLSEQLQKDSWEYKKNHPDPDFHMDFDKLADQSKMEREEEGEALH